MSKTGPDITAKYTILSFPSHNMAECCVFPKNYLEKNLILLGSCQRLRAYNKIKGKHFASYKTDRGIWVQIAQYSSILMCR